MAGFAAGLPNRKVRERLEIAISGKGAFSRFRDAVEQEGLVDSWRGFSTDRSYGQLRAYLAAEGIRVR